MQVDGVPTVFAEEEVTPKDNLLEVVYDKGPVVVRGTVRRGCSSRMVFLLGLSIEESFGLSLRGGTGCSPSSSGLPLKTVQLLGRPRGPP